LVAEIEAPGPDLIICSLILVAMLFSFFLPDRKDEDLYNQEEETGVSLNFPKKKVPESTGVGTFRY